jgi:hypothetical protein
MLADQLDSRHANGRLCVRGEGPVQLSSFADMSGAQNTT